MFARIAPSSLRLGLLLGLASLPLYASCASSEDTEPFVPAVEGAKQPGGEGALLTEADACERLQDAAHTAYSRLGCKEPAAPACPAYLRPAGGTGCFQYFEDSVEACEKAYDDAVSCRELSQCVVDAQQDDTLLTCDRTDLGAAGAGTGGAPTGDAGAPNQAGGMAAGGVPADGPTPGGAGESLGGGGAGN